MTPTTSMISATSVPPEEAGMPAAAYEFCGVHKKSLKCEKCNPLIYSV
jgi:hypothetical protein